jgi:hypothetical protein
MASHGQECLTRDQGPEMMDMGSKGVLLLEFSWLMWWIDALLGPTRQGMHVMAEKACA